MRARDVRAIGFCSVSTLVLLVGSWVILHSLTVSLTLTTAYAAWVLTRRRMIRVFHRLRGDPDWSGYYDNDGTRLQVRSEPGTVAPPPRPAEPR
jgi:hypothetical protein